LLKLPDAGSGPAALRLAGEGFRVGGLKFGEHRADRPARAKMKVAQLVYEGRPERGASFLEQLGADAKLAADRCVAAAPGAHLGEEGTSWIEGSVRL